MGAIEVRRAVVADIPALLRLEVASFSGDRMGPRNFRWMINQAHGVLLVADRAGELLGYILVLYRRGSRRARIYSIAVAASARGAGIAGRLLLAAEAGARVAGCTDLQLEVRPDNVAAMGLYVKHGYRPFGRYAGFYEDGADAVRLGKALE